MFSRLFKKEKMGYKSVKLYFSPDCPLKGTTQSFWWSEDTIDVLKESKPDDLVNIGSRLIPRSWILLYIVK